MELQRATKEGVLELDRISAKIGSTVNAVWGTVEGDITLKGIQCLCRTI